MHRETIWDTMRNCLGADHPNENALVLLHTRRERFFFASSLPPRSRQMRATLPRPAALPPALPSRCLPQRAALRAPPSIVGRAPARVGVSVSAMQPAAAAAAAAAPVKDSTVCVCVACWSVWIARLKRNAVQIAGTPTKHQQHSPTFFSPRSRSPSSAPAAWAKPWPPWASMT